LTRSITIITTPKKLRRPPRDMPIIAAAWKPISDLMLKSLERLIAVVTWTERKARNEMTR